MSTLKASFSVLENSFLKTFSTTNPSLIIVWATKNKLFENTCISVNPADTLGAFVLQQRSLQLAFLATFIPYIWSTIRMLTYRVFVMAQLHEHQEVIWLRISMLTYHLCVVALYSLTTSLFCNSAVISQRNHKYEFKGNGGLVGSSTKHKKQRSERAAADRTHI